jgi:beta-xylosidase
MGRRRRADIHVMSQAYGGSGVSSARVRALVLALLAVLGIVLAAPSGAVPALPGAAYTGDFPDPHVLRVGDVYYAYSTTTGGRHLPVLQSADLRTWVSVHGEAPVVGDALPRPAWWSAHRHGGIATETWAPSVVQLGGRFIAYYSVRVPSPVGRMCISLATSAAPQGPFVDSSVQPLVCDPDPHGSIDPYPFVDPRTGRAYLLWKAEGNPGRSPRRLLVRELQGDGLGFVAGSTPRELLRPTQPWEGGVVENPAMVLHHGRLLLFWSGNHWDTAAYAEGVATCRSPLGPCTKQGTRPLMASAGQRLGRAGAAPFVDADGRLRLAYHWWQAPRTSYAVGGQRRMAIATVTVHGGRVRVTG